MKFLELNVDFGSLAKVKKISVRGCQIWVLFGTLIISVL